MLAAQLFSGVPLAGAICICAWGSALLSSRAWMPTVLAIYVPLAGVAIAAQLHPAASVDRPFASLDALAATLLALLLTRYGFARLTT